MNLTRQIITKSVTACMCKVERYRGLKNHKVILGLSKGKPLLDGKGANGKFLKHVHHVEHIVINKYKTFFITP